MFVRSFEGGSEKGFSYTAGDGLDVTDRPYTGDEPGADDEDHLARSGRADEEIYNFIDDDGDGRVDEDLAPLGGSAQIVYLHTGRKLKRGIRSPAGSEFASMFSKSQVIADNVLFFGLKFATPYTSIGGAYTLSTGAANPLAFNWTAPRTLPTKKHPQGPFGPEDIWDSTRGNLSSFSWYAGPQSRDDGDDDVFPEAIRVTLVVEPHELRTLRTDLTQPVSDMGGVIRVASTRGFPPPGRDDSYVLIDDEWMHYKEMDARSLIIDKRGARDSIAATHERGASVRCGRTFTCTFYLAGHRNEEAVRSGGGRP
jgi:hypothetical protein